jgi:hypothetical protein
MAFMRLAFFPNGSEDHWEAVVAEVGDVLPPVARRAFAAGPAEGGWQVMQLWDSRADLEQFNDEVFLPAILRLGERGFPQPPTIRDVDTVKAWVGGEELA